MKLHISRCYRGPVEHRASVASTFSSVVLYRFIGEDVKRDIRAANKRFRFSVELICSPVAQCYRAVDVVIFTCFYRKKVHVDRESGMFITLRTIFWDTRTQVATWAPDYMCGTVP